VLSFSLLASAIAVASLLLFTSPSRLHAQAAATTQNQTADQGTAAKSPQTSATIKSSPRSSSSGTTATANAPASESAGGPPAAKTGTATAAGPPLPPTKPQEQVADKLARNSGKSAALASATAPPAPGAAKPGTATASLVVAQMPPSPGMVWANPNSRVYHKAGSRWYGKTRQGQWMTEQDAVKAGYHAAKQ
jgi:hypothetical protein